MIDKGLNLRDVEGLFDTAGEFVDIVKLGWGTGRHEQPREEDRAHHSFKPPVVCGGTLFEAVCARGRMDEFKAGWSSSGSRTSRSRTGRSRSRGHKLELIADFAQDFTVLSEVGSKDADVGYAPYLWVRSG